MDAYRYGVHPPPITPYQPYQQFQPYIGLPHHQPLSLYQSHSMTPYSMTNGCKYFFKEK